MAAARLLEREDARPIVLHADHEPAVLLDFVVQRLRERSDLRVGQPLRGSIRISSPSHGCAPTHWQQSNITKFSIFFLRIGVRGRTLHHPSAPPDLSDWPSFPRARVPKKRLCRPPRPLLVYRAAPQDRGSASDSGAADKWVLGGAYRARRAVGGAAAAADHRGDASQPRDGSARRLCSIPDRAAERSDDRPARDDDGGQSPGDGSMDCVDGRTRLLSRLRGGPNSRGAGRGGGVAPRRAGGPPDLTESR